MEQNFESRKQRALINYCNLLSPQEETVIG